MAIDSISGAYRAAIVFEMPSIGRGATGPATATGQAADDPAGSRTATAGTVGAAGSASAAAKATSTETPTRSQALETQRKIDKLKAIEQGVISHELAHKGAGGPYAGAVSYSYTTGPDGKRYITGGEVSIDLSSAGSPEATVRKMRQVISAALAPVDPSGQDYRVASQAQALQLEAQRQVAAESASAGAVEEAGDSGNAGKATTRTVAVGAYAVAGLRTDEAPPPESISLYA